MRIAIASGDGGLACDPPDQRLEEIGGAKALSDDLAGFPTCDRAPQLFFLFVCQQRESCIYIGDGAPYTTCQYPVADRIERHV